jgi:hypothetical protein
MTRIVTFVLAIAFSSGCASPVQPGAASNGDWKYSDVTSAIAVFQKQQAAVGHSLSLKIRSIYPDSADSLRVYLSNDAGFRGRGFEVTLKRLPSGTWVAVESHPFDY